MKLAYFSFTRFPGEKANSRQIALMCHWFARQGVETTLVAARRRWQSPECRGLQPQDLFRFYGVEGFGLVVLPCLDWVTPGPSSPVEFLTQSLLSLSYAFHAMRWAAGAGRSADVFYTRDPLLAWCLHLAGIQRAKIYLEVHSVEHTSPWLWRFGFAACAGIIAMTRGIERELRVLGFKGRAIVCPDAIDPAAFSATGKLFASPHKVIGYFGRFRSLEAEKGLYDAIDAFAIVSKQVPDAELRLIGGSEPEVREYKAVVEKLGSQGRVVVQGFIDPKKIPACINSFDVCLLPLPFNRHFAYCVSPLKLFEYMALGKPIVATTLPALLEVLQDGRNAVLVEPSNPESLAQGILRVLRDKALATRIGAQARADALEKYTWEKRAQAILGMMKEVA